MSYTWGAYPDMSAKERILSAFSRFTDTQLCDMYRVKKAGCGGNMSRAGRLQRLATYYMSRQNEIKAFLDMWATDPMEIDDEWTYSSPGKENTFNFDAMDTNHGTSSTIPNIFGSWVSPFQTTTSAFDSHLNFTFPSQ
jgi:hypothetical protein